MHSKHNSITIAMLKSKNNTCFSCVCRTTFSAVHVLRVHDPAVQLFIAPLYAIPFIIMTN